MLLWTTAKNCTVCSLWIYISLYLSAGNAIMLLQWSTRHNLRTAYYASGFIHQIHMASAGWHRILLILVVLILHRFLMLVTDLDFWTGRVEQKIVQKIWTIHTWVSLTFLSALLLASHSPFITSMLLSIGISQQMWLQEVTSAVSCLSILES